MPQGKRGGGKNSGQKSNKSPQRGRGGRRFGGSTRAQLDKLITLREYTWTTNANQEVVIHAPSRSDVEKISRQFPKGAVSYQVTHEGKPYKVNFDDDEDIDSDVSDSDEDREDMLEAYQEQEAEVIKSIESFFADMPEHEQELLEDYVKNLGLTDQDLVANIAAFTIYENQEIYDDIDQKTKLDLSVPVSHSRKVPNYRQRNMQKSPGSPSPKKSPIKKKTPQKSPKTSPTAWISGGFMNEQENPETKIEIEEEITLILSDEEDVEEQVPFNGQYSDSDEEEEERQLPKKKGPEFKKKKSFTLKDMHAINLHIRDFIEEPIMLSMPFSPMSKTQRFQVSRLASFYGIKTKNVGAGKRCYAELVKTHKTRLFTIEDATTFMEEIFEDVKIEESIENNKKKSSPAKKPTRSPKKNDKYEKDSKKSPNQKKDDKYGKYQKNKSPNPSPNTKGALVAQNAKPLDDNNLGSRLLKSMGWSGGGLGATGQGIVDPINAVIKQDRKGLGAY